MNKELFANFRSAKTIEVLKVEVNEGEGTSEDPVQRVAYLISKTGEVLAKLGENKERKFAGENEMIIIK